ncbi:MAG: hypothetical protein ACI8PZ_000548 [Myxococcota bacterium]|jgi:hypothetical protein
MLFAAACVSSSGEPEVWAGGAGMAGPPGPAPIVVNEVYTNNDSLWADPRGGFPDVVELYNPGPDDLSLDRVTLTDGSEATWQGPAEVLAAGHTYVVMADDGVGPDHAPFRLSADGDWLTLSVDGLPVDRLATGVQPDDVGMARFPDGGTFRPSTLATLGAPNPAEPPATLDPRDQVFQGDRVIEIDMRLTPEAYDILAAGGGFGGPRNSAPAAVTIDGVAFPEVAVKLKGSGSFEPITGKPAWKIDLNKAIPGTRFRKLKALTLNNGNTFDPTRAHEDLSYALAREVGVPAPRVGWVHLTVNDMDYGLYQNIETWDDVLVERLWPGDVDGQLWEGSGSDFGSFWFGGGLNFDYEEGPEDPDTWVIDAIDAIVDGPANASAIEALWQVVDRDAFLTYMAWEIVAAHWDGYKSPNNWRFYVHGGKDQALWLATGTDFTWWEAPETRFGGSVANFCLDVPVCATELSRHLLVVSYAADDMDLVSRFEQRSTLIDPFIFSDPRSKHTDGAIRRNRASTRDLLESNPADARRLAVGL